ncbi:hypothetical protein LTR64_004624 [Lithohypha guttulata]|uniref:uncharacterized protein n=1 Tax=Lithohypha guttulata TaxID=1690604 RepID=UPI002DDFC3B3|nr:hypothetical protein LTR51_006078 [Lithohypha guttulata]
MSNEGESDLTTPRKLWQHPNPQSTRMWKFIQKCNATYGLSLGDFHDTYEWSTGLRRNDFWTALWDEVNLIHEGSYVEPVDDSVRMDSIPRWFDGIKLNFAENILFNRGSRPGDLFTDNGKTDTKIAITEVREGMSEVHNYTWADIRRSVGLLSNAMRAHGVKKGDRVAVVGSNSKDTLCTFLATTAVGGIFSSSSTDMGTNGILERLRQIEPIYIFIDDFAVYNGKTTALRSKIQGIIEGLKDKSNLKGIVIQPRFSQPADIQSLPRTLTLEEFVGAARGNVDLQFERVPFNDPLLIVYSSGTTGAPKCIVHSVGGVLINAVKESALHRSMGPESVQLQYTTNKVVPRKLVDLSSLKHVVSTGMVLSDQLFEWFYDTGFPQTAQLANISGGTDIAGCFGMENPLNPVYVGGCQGPSLGTAIAVFEERRQTDGSPQIVRLEDGVPGELVATKSFPNQPAFFWGENGSQRYFDSYFSRFDNTWSQNDFIMIHPVTKQIFFLGRADGVLNPSGVRFGSAEIYNVLEQHIPEVQDSICVGQRRKQDDDESVLLFLLMAPGQKFTAALIGKVKQIISRELSKRHVPKYIFETPEIPMTINGKKVELPVKQVVSGFKIKPSSTLTNPGCLAYYAEFAEDEKLSTASLERARL